MAQPNETLPVNLSVTLFTKLHHHDRLDASVPRKEAPDGALVVMEVQMDDEENADQSDDGVRADRLCQCLQQRRQEENT